MRRRTRRLAATVVALLAVGLAVVLGSASPAVAYGHNGTLDMWQVGLSMNCNNPAVCGTELGGFWGWVQFTRDPVTGETDADAQLTGCQHMVRSGGPGTAGAFHFSAEATWVIGPGSAGQQTFLLTGGTMTFTGRGGQTTVPLTNDDGSLTTPANPNDTGIPAVPGHYSTQEILGFTAPGVAFQIPVAFKPAH